METKRIGIKIKSYVYQDCETLGMNEECKKGENLPINYIDINDVEVLLKIQENKCYICKEQVLVNYTSGCKNQFTLDRINSKNPHLKGNILIACWYCNCIDYNRQINCKNNCCINKSVILRKKNDVPNSEIDMLIYEYNKVVNGNYSPFDDYKDYCDYIKSEIYHEETGGIERSFSSNKACRDYFILQEKINTKTNKLSKLSRRERKNLETEEGYCVCGRKDEDGSFGCNIWPSCCDD
jgi:hypothetical protein